MSIGAVLETAIGLIFVFLLLGLMASALQEAFAAMTKLRGKYLLEGLSRLLADNASAFWRVKNPAHLFGQPIESVKADDASAKAKPAAARGPAGPTPPASPDNTSALFRVVTMHPLVANSGSNTVPSYVTPANFVTAVVDALRNPAVNPAARTTPAASAPATPDDLIKEIGAGIDLLPEGPAKRALGAVFAESKQSVDEFKARVEAWFDAGMERVSGVYKRFSQYFALGFGLVIAIGLNVDTIGIADYLWRNPEERAAVVAAADAYVQEAADDFDPETDVDGTDTPATAEEVAANLDATLEAVSQRINALALPIGWEDAGNPLERPLMILGWLLTALAVSLGAPFWFDLLKKFMRIRAAGKAPDEAA